MSDPIEAEEQIDETLDALLAGVSLSTLAVIIERMKDIKPDTTLAEALAHYPEDMKRAESILASGKLAVDEYTNQVFTAMARGNDQWAKQFYKAAGIEQKPIMTGALRATVDDGVEAAQKITSQMMKTSVVGIETKGVYIPFKEVYKRTIAEGVTSMKSGDVTFQKALENACKSFSNSGLKVVYPNTYKKNIVVRGKVIDRVSVTRSEPLVRELNSALRMNILDNYRQTMSALRWAQAEEFGADGVEIDAHGLCAPDHAPFQGKQYTLKQFDDIQNVLPRPFEEMNCTHTVSPIILGVSEPALSKSELEELRQSSFEKVDITGLDGNARTMTRYEATQYQREIERKMRATNEQLYMNPGDQAAKAAKRQYSAVYKDVSKQAGLTTRMERTRAYVAS